MAKKAQSEPKQMRMEGTYDPVPQAVEDKAQEYSKALRARQRMQEKENTLRAECVELMHEHKVERVELDDERMLVLEPTGEKLRIKKRSELTAAADE